MSIKPEGKKKVPSPASKHNRKRMSSTHYLKYSGMAFQMILYIAVGAFLGQWLDNRFHIEEGYFTVACLLLFSLGGMYIVLKDIISGKD